MSKKGFTLVELLGVISVLCIMLIVTVPAVTLSLRNAERKKYDSFVETILNGTEFYIEMNRSKFTELDEDLNMTVFIGDLIDNGYLKDNLVNPKTNEVIDRDELVAIYKNSDNTLYYEYPSQITGWVTESILNDLGYQITDTGVESKVQYKITYDIVESNVESTSGSYMNADAKTLFSKNFGKSVTITGWYTDVDTSTSDWTNYIGPAQQVYCDGTQIGSVSAMSGDSLVFEGSGSWSCSVVEINMSAVSGNSKTFVTELGLYYDDVITKTTDWQNSNTTNLGIITNTETRTVYRYVNN